MAIKSKSRVRDPGSYTRVFREKNPGDSDFSRITMAAHVKIAGNRRKRHFFWPEITETVFKLRQPRFSTPDNFKPSANCTEKAADGGKPGGWGRAPRSLLQLTAIPGNGL